MTQTLDKTMNVDYSDIVQFFDTQPMTLTTEQVSELLTAHCYRVIDNMDADTLFSYAMQMMMDSFSKNPGCFDIDEDALLEDILIAEDEDEDAAVEFLIGAGIEPELAEKLMKEDNQD
jgi:hypothetical protein